MLQKMIFVNPNAVSSGQVRLFEYDGTDWIQIGQTLNGEVAHDELGWCLSMSFDGKRALLSSHSSNSVNGAGSGRAQVFEEVYNVWVQVYSEVLGDTGSDNLGANECTISDNGKRFVVVLQERCPRNLVN